MTESVERPAPGVVRVMTWNIHGGAGRDRRRDLQRVVELVRRHHPQIVALQEIDSRKRPPSAPDAFTFLGDELGGNARASRLIRAPDGDYGHALISSWPLAPARYHDISYRRREPRAAIETTVETPHGQLHVVAAHLGLSFRERHHQALKLARIVRRGKDRGILMGDLNDWTARGSARRILDRLFPGHSYIRTFPAFWPLLPLDRIYCQPRTMLSRCWTDRNARAVSDHLPLIADLVLEDGP
ncbi:endonuclease/exonuclease/phosphatase family protein [Roseovarius spongiae]|nr:endonuclease/exonuclease/phosphatase family protein [Roseovarius spongiae]